MVLAGICVRGDQFESGQMVPQLQLHGRRVCPQTPQVQQQTAGKTPANCQHADDIMTIKCSSFNKSYGQLLDLVYYPPPPKARGVHFMVQK